MRGTKFYTIKFATSLYKFTYAMLDYELDLTCSWSVLQCESMVAVERRLKELGIPYIQRCVEEGGIYVDQIFFHDPDGFMIEICNCDNLPVVPLGADQPLVMAACKRAAVIKQQQQASSSPATAAAAAQCAVPSSTKAIHVGEEAHISCA